ncbi:MAG: NifB/NifX family molybdenum-iron cluster-binding protein [Clostridia bacterium]|nr:NifB/NifX family molybdenum-iron cluster-binding protein [Clostridia bacterium]
MKIAVPYQAGQIFQHFGHTAQFKLYTVEDGAVTAMTVVPTNGSGHGALSAFLVAHGVDTLICGGIGGGAQAALAEANIRLYGGAAGDADYAVAMLLAGKLEYDPAARCDHHDHHHGEGHTCGEHGCGEHTCGEHTCGHHE